MKRQRGIGIAVKMILVSTLLLVIVISLFGVLNDRQSRRLIDDAMKRLQAEMTDSLKQAGISQIQLLSQAVRVALVQSDYVTIQTIVRDMSKQDRRITGIAVVDRANRVLAHTSNKYIGKEAVGLWKKKSTKLSIQPEVEVESTRSIVFSAPMMGKVEVIEEEEDGSSTVTEAKSMVLGHVFLAYSLKPLELGLAAAEKAKKVEVRRSLRRLLIVGLGAVLLGVILTILQGLRMTRPIKALAVQTNRMSVGDLDAKVDVKSGDEIGMLGLQFNDMAARIRDLIETTKESAAMEKELEVAAVVQSTLVPDNEVATLGSIRLAGYFKSAAKCGGDWWSYHQLQEDKVLIIISDVTGHGIASAMITAAAKGVTTTLMGLTHGRIELPVLLDSLNDTICSTGKGRFAMTCFASIYDAKTRVLTYSNAGHNFPYHYDGETRELTALALPGDRLGDFPKVGVEMSQIRLKAQDTIVWYTDGLVECEDPSGQEYGERRLQSTIQANAHLPPDQAVEMIANSAKMFYGSTPQKDDITLIVGKIS
jgi:serine phosphatase RsbU (regulator of sigma subunit)